MAAPPDVEKLAFQPAWSMAPRSERGSGTLISTSSTGQRAHRLAPRKIQTCPIIMNALQPILSLSEDSEENGCWFSIGKRSYWNNSCGEREHSDRVPCQFAPLEGVAELGSVRARSEPSPIRLRTGKRAKQLRMG